MSLRFRGGERMQKGRGVGGLLRAVAGFFKPILQTVGRTAVKAVRSNTGKMITNAVKDQALSSASNMLSDALRGNDLHESIQNEVVASKKTFGDTIENAIAARKREAHPLRNFPKKIKRSQLKVLTKKGKQIAPRGYASYTDEKVKDMLDD